MKPTRAHLLLCLLTLAALASTGCHTHLRAPDLGRLYNAAAAAHGPGRNPIIVIPGILGSRLIEEQTQRVVWGAFAGGYADPRTPDGARLIGLPLTLDERGALPPDGVVAAGVLDRVRLRVLGLPLDLNAYANILATLGAGGYRDEELGRSGAIRYGSDHYTCFQFAYDWRRDNAENAARLHEFIESRRASVQQQLEREHGLADYDVQFDLVAHSMGGLIARYYLQYGAVELPEDGPLPELTWAGANRIGRAVLVGTPNAGSAEALRQLVEGKRIGPITRYAPAILGSMPSVYQLLPRTRHAPLVDAADGGPLTRLYDPEFWVEMQWGLADPRQSEVLAHLHPEIESDDARRAAALAALARHLRRAERFHAALDRPATPPAGLELSLFLGDATPTLQQLAVERGSGRLSVRSTGAGDGTVLRSSALLDERTGGEFQRRLASPIAWRQVVALFSDHLAMTGDPIFSDNVLYQLLEAPR